MFSSTAAGAGPADGAAPPPAARSCWAAAAPACCCPARTAAAAARYSLPLTTATPPPRRDSRHRAGRYRRSWPSEGQASCRQVSPPAAVVADWRTSCCRHCTFTNTSLQLHKTFSVTDGNFLVRLMSHVLEKRTYLLCECRSCLVRSDEPFSELSVEYWVCDDVILSFSIIHCITLDIQRQLL